MLAHRVKGRRRFNLSLFHLEIGGVAHLDAHHHQLHRRVGQGAKSEVDGAPEVPDILRGGEEVAAKRGVKGEVNNNQNFRLDWDHAVVAQRKGQKNKRGQHVFLQD